MADNLTEFPAAPPEPPSLYSGEREAYVARQLERLRQERGETALTAEQQAYKDRMQRAADFHAAKIAAERDTARQQIADFRDKTNESPHRNLHEAANAQPAPETDDADVSDFQADSFAREIGVDAAALGGVGSFEDVSTATREALGKLMDEISDQELLAVVQNSPKIANQFRAEADRELDRLGSPQYGYRGQATEEQQRAREVAILNALRIGLAQTKRKSTVPPMGQLLSRARLAAGDQSFTAGKKGAVREFAEPADLPRSIHHALQQCPY